jgi:hypothetical protein
MPADLRSEFEARIETGEFVKAKELATARAALPGAVTRSRRRAGL